MRVFAQTVTNMLTVKCSSQFIFCKGNKDETNKIIAGKHYLIGIVYDGRYAIV